MAAGVVVAGQVVELLPAMLLGGGKLAHDLAALGIVRHRLCSRQIAYVQGHVPVKGRPSFVAAEFRLADGVGQTLAALAEIGSHVGAAHGPQAEPFRGPWHSRRLPFRRESLSPQTQRRRVGCGHRQELPPVDARAVWPGHRGFSLVSRSIAGTIWC